MTGYEALRRAAAWIDLSARGRIRVTGEDRKRLLHAMTTNHVQDMAPGRTLYAFFLNAQGRIQADVWIYCAEESLLLDVEPEVREKIHAHLDRYIIADDVTLDDVTPSTAEIAVEGPSAGDAARRGMVIEPGVTGQPGFRMVFAAQEKAGVIAELDAAGIVQASLVEARIVRIENGVPRYGEDITDAHLVHETGRLDGVHFNKGCYLGQEIVERVRSQGSVHKRLYPLRVEAVAPPAAGEKVYAGQQEAGTVTSAVWSPGESCVRAFGYLRAVENLSVAGAPAQIVQK